MMRRIATDFASTAASGAAVPAERRAHVRYRCETPAVGRVFLANAFRSMSARILDISAGGIGLLMPDAVPLGTRLNVELEGHGAMPFEMLAEVVNVTPQPDGSCRCGCDLVWKISEAELQLLLK
jgi:hypothetical protein